ncbi:MAG: hypothetical protein HY720_17355 [Planctomycetes bacterium]|nr:hypothetical protein [Planctomycetota bacterium]
MNKTRAALSVLLAFAIFPGLARAQEPPPAEGDGDKEPPVFVEKTIYAPFDKLEEILQKEGKSIYLPYDEFVRLWRKAEERPVKPEPEKPPAPVVLQSAVYEGAVEEGRARIGATLAVQSLAEGWSELALPFSGVAIEEVNLSNGRALFAARDQGYALYLPEAGEYEAKIAFSLAVEESPGKKSIQFRLPSAAIGRIDLTIPGKDLKVDATPKTALSVSETDDGNTRASVYLGQVAEMTLSWMPTVEKGTEEGALVFARQVLRAHLGERTLRIETGVHFEVMRGEVDAFKIETPRDTRAISVEGDNLKEWGLAEEGEKTNLWVRLHSSLKRKDSYELALAFERILDETPAALAIPLPRTQGTLRESGHLVLSWAPSLDVRVTRSEGLSQLDPEDVPEPLRPHLGLGFAYLAHPLALEVAAERITPTIHSSTTSVVVLGPEEDVWSGWIDYEIKKAGVFQLAFAVPESWSVASVGAPETVEEFQTADADGQRTVTAQLKSKAIGEFRLPFRLTRLGTAASGEQAFSPPLVAGTRQDRGLFGVAVPKKMEARTLEKTKMTDADREELIRSGVLGQLGSETSLPLAYRYREQPAGIRLDIREKARQIDVLAQHLIEVTDGEIRHTHWLDLDVLYAPADTIRFRAPAELDEKIKIEVKDKTSERKVSSEGGVTLWEVHVAPPVLGSVTLTVTHTHDLASLGSGESAEYRVPLVHSADAPSESGFVAIRKEGSLAIETSAEDAEPIGTVDLPGKLRQGKIDSAFRYYAPDPKVVLRLTRHDYQRLATTVVDRLHAQCVLTRERKLRTKVVLSVQNVERTYLELALSPSSLRGLSVAGKSQAPKKASGGETTLVEIPRSAGREGWFEIVVDYEEALGDEMGLAGAVEARTLRLVADDIPIGKVDVEIYLPPEFRYLAFGGNMEEEEPAPAGIWTSFSRLFGGFFGPSKPRPEAARGRSRPAGRGGDSIEIELPTEGLVRHRYGTLAPEGTLDFWFVEWKFYAFVQFLMIVLAAGGSHVVLARRQGRKLQVGLLLVLVPFLALVFAGGALAEFLAAATTGAFLVAGYQGARFLWTKYREHQAARKESDPYLEGGTREAERGTEKQREELKETKPEGEEKKESGAGEKKESEGKKESEEKGEGGKKA